jgi:5-methylcytosine-specific restriction endonuclease McrA
MKKRFYDSIRWRKIRGQVLSEEPLCRFCHDLYGRDTQANVVDHIVPHRGNYVLFFDRNNMQSLCESCHNGLKQAMEKGGASGCDINGMPINPKHHWR